MNICICDDDAVFCSALKNKLLALDKKADVKIFRDAEALLQKLSGSGAEYDLFFLDIRLSGDSPGGIELAKKLAELCRSAQIVYVTAYPEYVSDVYETEHCYFIKKSDLDSYLPKALEKASRLLSERAVLFNSPNGLVRVFPREIRYIERMGRHSDIITVSGRHISVYKSLGDIEAALSDREFACCHYSFIIPLRLVRSLTRADVELDGGVKVPVSRSRYGALKLSFARYMGGTL